MPVTHPKRANEKTRRCMRRKRISKEWRKTLLNQLQQRYGLTAKEATEKTDAWLQWIHMQSGPEPNQPSLASDPTPPGSRARPT
jgi:hypothetical protein